MKQLKVLSLFSGCGGLDIGMEGGFVCHRRSVGNNENWIESSTNGDWVKLKETAFRTIFANDILDEAMATWTNYMSKRGHRPEEYRMGSIVDYVKSHNEGVKIFPDDVDVVTGGFPCQDFSLAGKRLGFDSHKNHDGTIREESEPTEETRGKLYFWMKQVIDITKPKIFIAENVKGLVSLGDVKKIIQKDFESADGDGYIVLNPRVLHAADYGVPEKRERVIFIGIRKDLLNPNALEALTQDVVPQEYDPYPYRTHSYTSHDNNLPEPVTCAEIFKGLPEPSESDDLSHQNFSHAKYMGDHCQGQIEIDIECQAPTIRSEHHGNIEFRRLSLEHGGKRTDELESGMQERRLTPRECALIQTFPPDYEFVRRKDKGAGFVVSASGAYKVIGNAVPPMLGYNIANRLMQVWGKYFD